MTSSLERSPICAITSYFNPMKYARRLQNYRLFRRHLTVPLITVELSCASSFALASGDADALIQLEVGDVMWQKERLLNLALQALPRNCEAVAWLDADVLFEKADWAEKAMRKLEDFPVLQPFSEFRDLRPDGQAGKSSPMQPCSCASFLAGGGALSPQNLGSTRIKGGPLFGLARAARRSPVEGHGCYDACVLGSGVLAMAVAAAGVPEIAVGYLRMNLRQEEHYLSWARPWHESVGGKIGCLEGRISHLWHGSLRDRRYKERHREFRKFGFNPHTDITPTAQGPWRWSSEKGEMHRYVRNYFLSRKEDGLTSIGPAAVDTAGRMAR